MDEAKEEESDTLHLTPQKQLARLVENLKRLLTSPSNTKHIDRRVERITFLLDYFQEDPLLLDPHLSSVLPPLIACYLKAVQSDAFVKQEPQIGALVRGLSKVLYSFCKVRGRKVICRFLDNEPHLLEPLLKAYAVSTTAQSTVDANSESNLANGSEVTNPSTFGSWQQHYVLVLWLSQLSLTPFDLSTISSIEKFEGDLQGLQCLSGTPFVAKQLLEVGVASIASATTQRVVGADLLVHLSLRPDMQKVGLHACTIYWALTMLRSATETAGSLHKQIGLLMFLKGMFSSGALDSIGSCLLDAYDNIMTVMELDQNSSQALNASSVVRRLCIRIRRDFLVNILKQRSTVNEESRRIVSVVLETRDTLESVIENMLQALADRDTQVRLAASKALSMIAQHLDQDMADEIVEAVLESLREDVLEGDDTAAYTAVDAVRWHGLTMTLSHMLFRRTASATQLRKILQALYMSLMFEQRSSSGHSVGSNVRDAANFGLWSLARRYTTEEIRAQAGSDTFQRTAEQLVCAACLDPAGNVRRGSSAALQELVGRHPDTVNKGISLIQVVDYQSVGRRYLAKEKGMETVAHLDDTFRDALLKEIFSWRGTRAPDVFSRGRAAAELFYLALMLDVQDLTSHLERCAKTLVQTPLCEIEIRQGLILAYVSLLRTANEFLRDPESHCKRRIYSGLQTLLNSTQSLTMKRLGIDVSQLKPFSRHLDLLADCILFFLHERATTTSLVLRSIIAQGDHKRRFSHQDLRLDLSFWNSEVFVLYAAALKTRREDDDRISRIIRHVYKMLDVVEILKDPKLGNLVDHQEQIPSDSEIISDWYKTITNTKNPRPIPSVQLAAGQALEWAWGADHDPPKEDGPKDIYLRLCDRLILNALHSAEIEIRRTAIQAVAHLPRLPKVRDSYLYDHILRATYEAMNDYTTTEQGDIGSVLRVESLKSFWNCVQSAESPLPAQILMINHSAPTNAFACYTSCLRLAFDRLDKVRKQAISVLVNLNDYIYYNTLPTIGDISSYDYFATQALTLRGPSDQVTVFPDEVKPKLVHDETMAVLEGFAISAGSGSSSILPAAREALADMLDELPLFPTCDTPTTHKHNLFEICNIFSELLSDNLTNERVLVPLLELIAYLLDYGFYQRLLGIDDNMGDSQLSLSDRFNFRKLLSLVQEAHFKSTNLPKLSAAVSVYSGLLDIPEIRTETLTKLISMLLHPFPMVRVAVAEVLWVATQDDALKPRLWSNPPSNNKEIVAGLKERHLVESKA